MRVLIAHSRYLSGSTSGENRMAEDEAKLLSDAGHDVHVWSPEPDVGSRLDVVKTGASAVWAPQRELRTEIRRHRAQVVHFHNLFPTLSPAALRTADAEGAAVCVTLHNYRLMCLPATFLRDGAVCELCLGKVPWRGVRYRCYRGSAAGSAALATSLTLHRAANTFDRVTRFFAVSGFVRDKYVQAGFDPDRVRVKRNFAWGTERRVGAGEYFLYLGRLSPEKGVETLLEAWRSAPGKLLVVGGGPDADALRRAAPAGVEFAGEVDSGDVAVIVAKARALLVPSRWYEAAPRGITEAYAAGVPVLASRIGALEEAVTDDISGWLLPHDDPAAWAAAAERLSDDAEAERLGAGAFEIWETSFSPERGLAGLEAAYEEALAARGTSG
jgi:glycosyltransferase involved in cell wall biosynthesis